jgi:hypothetical protein
MSNYSSNVANPYTKKIPSGTLNQVQLTNPQDVQIQWPNRSGNNLPNNTKTLPGIFRKLFQ